MRSLQAEPFGSLRPAAAPHFDLQRALLSCGLLAAGTYAFMNVYVPQLYVGYSLSYHTVSELSAIGAPTRNVWVALGAVYSLLYLAFAWGVWSTAKTNRELRIVGGALLVCGLLGFFWPPMHQREVLASGGKALTDTLHIAWTAVWALLTLVAMGYSASAIKGRFRILTGLCMAALLAFGILGSFEAPAMEANQPTPWIGLWERLNIAAFLVWLVAFSIALLREPEGVPVQGRQAAKTLEVEGFVLPGYEGVKDAFAKNFSERNELGGACCIYRDGEKVVDLWGGLKNEATGEPWEKDTMVIVFSTTKGLSAMTLALAHSRGWLDYDERICAYWPEFAQNGKDRMTVRQLLAHQGGLHAFHQKVDRATIADLDRFAEVMAAERPEWAPGEHQAYHAITLGFYENELLRRVDPKHRSLGQFFQEEFASPLELDCYIRLPESIPNSRLATLDKGNMWKSLMALPLPLRLASLNPRSHIFRALMVNPGSWVSLDENTVYARNLEVPSGGGVATARGIARAYSAFATGGRELGLSAETIRQLTAPATPSAHGFFDEALRGEVEFSLGFMKPCRNWPFGHEGAFGSPGAGGSLAYADPEARLAYAYVTNRMGTVDGDPREVALRQAIPA